MNLNIYRYTKKVEQKFPLYLSQVPAGFPSPADDYIEKSLDLNEYLINHPESTFFVRVKGDSMINAGIQNGSVLIVDRSLEAINNKIVVAILNGEFTVKRIKKYNGSISLVPENPNYSPIEVTNNMDFEVWGVVVHVIHSV
ncbi:MAG: translesion error-prone DNA polymerase V autoproteolytic subunit [Candidatus Omnitrophica bacterium]|nr:translesion error-prone DNA polymerase V autoproteolytic subunit [Candidatus Omnitrophota bacterium]